MKMMKENKGLSLVELIITIAILGIVVAAATSFMITGSRSFARGSADADLQKEAELTVNQIEDLIIDINGGVSLTEDDEDGKTVLTMYHMGQPDSSNQTVYTKETVTWLEEATDTNLYYSKWNRVVSEDSTESWSRVVNEELFAENVASFLVDLSDTETERAADGTEVDIVRSVRISVGYEDSTGRVNYATSPIITLRNRLLAGSSAEEYFDVPAAMSAKLKLWYSGPEILAPKPIVDGDSEVERGNMYNIYAMLTEEEGANASSNVNRLVGWEIEEKNGNSTIDSNGILNVDENEPNDFLTITARYINNPDKKATGIVKVVGGDGKSLRAVTIAPQSLLPFKKVYGSFPTLRGYWTPDEVKAIQYQWEILGSVDEYVSFEGADNLATSTINIDKHEDIYGKLIRVRLTAHSDVTGETRTDEVTCIADEEGTSAGDSFMRRGMVYKGEDGSDVYFQFQTDYAKYVDWEWYFCNENGEKITLDDEVYKHVVVGFCEGNRATFDYQVSYDKQLPLNQEYYVKVVAHLDDGKGKKWTWDRIHYIPAVQIYDYHIYSGDSDGYFHAYFGMIGYYDVALQNASYVVGVEEAGLEYEVSDWINVYLSDNIQIVTGNEVGYNAMYIGGQVVLDGRRWSEGEIRDLKYLRLKVYMKEYPEVYTYIEIYFPAYKADETK